MRSELVVVGSHLVEVDYVGVSMNDLSLSRLPVLRKLNIDTTAGPQTPNHPVR